MAHAQHRMLMSSLTRALVVRDRVLVDVVCSYMIYFYMRRVAHE